MQGISQSKHQHLVDALLHLEMLLSKDDDATGADLQQAADYRLELEGMHRQYESLLIELSKVIVDYQDLFGRVKVQFLSKKLKTLKKQIPVDKPAMRLLVKNIQVAYGT